MVSEQSILRRIKENMKNLMEAQIKSKKMFLEFQSRNEEMFSEALNRTKKLENNLRELKTVVTPFLKRQEVKVEATIAFIPELTYKNKQPMQEEDYIKSLAVEFTPLMNNNLSDGSFVVPSPSEPSKIEMYSSVLYTACTAGGLLNCGLTHMMVTPLDFVKSNIQIDSAKYISISYGFGVLLNEQSVSFAGGYIAGVFCAIMSHSDNLISFLHDAKGPIAGDATKKMRGEKKIRLFIFCPLYKPP